jgi:hypothetical protein
MATIGLGLAVWGAWSCVASLLSEHNMAVKEDNSGCTWLIALFAVFATIGLIDAL